jgi:hypothetical protein
MASEMAGAEDNQRRQTLALHPAVSAVVTVLVRWDEPLKLGNEWFDRLVHTAQIEDHDQQQAESKRFNDDLKKLAAEVKIMPTRTGIWFYPRKIPTQLTSRGLVGVLLPALDAAIVAEKKWKTHRSMFQIGLSLAEYRIDHKAYPNQLNELVPKYIARVPVDDFRSRELLYQRTDDGYMFYSLGKNGRDDGGKSYDEDEDADDVTIRVPWKDIRPRASK